MLHHIFKPCVLAQNLTLIPDNIVGSKRRQCEYCGGYIQGACDRCQKQICSGICSTLMPNCSNCSYCGFYSCKSLLCYECKSDKHLVYDAKLGFTRCIAHSNNPLQWPFETRKKKHALSYDTLKIMFTINIRFHVTGNAEIYRCEDNDYDSVLARSELLSRWYYVLYGYMDLINDINVIESLEEKRNKLVRVWVGEVYIKMRYLLMRAREYVIPAELIIIILRWFAVADTKFILFWCVDVRLCVYIWCLGKAGRVC